MAGIGILKMLSPKGFLTGGFNQVRPSLSMSPKCLISSDPAFRLQERLAPAVHQPSKKLHHVACVQRYGSVSGNALLGNIQHPHSWCAIRSMAKKAKKEKVAKGGKKKVVLNVEELDGVLDLGRLQGEMGAVVDDLKHQMLTQLSLRTNIGAYDQLAVKTEDGVFPLIQLGQVVQKNPSLILINMAQAPQYAAAVKDAILQSGFNVNPQQEGTTLFVPLPKVTREFREGLAKSAKSLHDKAKVKLRDLSNKHSRKAKAAKAHHSEDVVKGAQDMVLSEMHNFGQQCDALLTSKQQELLSTK